jgi:hypothetical protein
LENISNKLIKEFNDYLFNNYLDESYLIIDEHLFQIYDMNNIPIALLSKYYFKMYSNGQDICNNMKLDLMTSNGFDSTFIPLVKILYNSIKFESFNLLCNKELYCAAEVKNYEIEAIKECLDNRTNYQFPTILFSKRFFSFSERKETSLDFMNNKKYNTLFILEINCNDNGKIATYANIQDISTHAEEKEILFFPFSTFKIKDFKYNEKENKYTIKLLYENFVNYADSDCKKNYKIEFLHEDTQNEEDIYKDIPQIPIIIFGDKSVGKNSFINYIKSNFIGGIISNPPKIKINVEGLTFEFIIFDKRYDNDDIKNKILQFFKA